MHYRLHTTFFVSLFYDDLSISIFYFIMNYDEETNIGYTLIFEADYPVCLQLLQGVLPFWPEKRVINRVPKLECTFYNKNYVSWYVLLKQALKHGLILKKVHAVMKFKQKMVRVVFGRIQRKMILIKVLINIYPIQYLVNQFNVKVMK